MIPHGSEALHRNFRCHVRQEENGKVITLDKVEIKSCYETWLGCCSDVERAELKVVKEGQIEDAFFRELAFGTGGLRGKLGLGPNRLNVYTVGKATQGLADYLNGTFENPTVALCRDTRHGSEEFVRRVAEVLAGNGIKSYLC